MTVHLDTLTKNVNLFGIGIPLIVLLGVGAFFFFRGRRAKRVIREF